MTDEQKEQLAREYADGTTPFCDHGGNNWRAAYNGYLAALNARDEEINKLQEENLHMESLLSMHRKMTGEYELKLQQLRNPLISVEDQLPPEFKPVIVIFDNGIIINAFMTMVKDEPAWHPSVEIPIGSDVIFWMHAPELKKEE